MSIRILCIEDDPGIAELIRAHLETFDCDVSIVHDGESGLAECYIQPFDVILVDNQLPGISGLDVINQLHEVNEYPPAVIMITGAQDDYMETNALQAGASEFLVKDVQGQFLEVLQKVITQIVEKQALQDVQQRMLEEQTRLIEELQAFGYAVAHDLKQPLAVLTSSVGLLERYLTDVNNPKVDKKLAQINQTITKMSGTLEALILFAHVRERTDIDLEVVDMKSLIEGILRQLEYMIEAHQVTLQVQPDIPPAYGYPPWVEQVWINYLTNAIKYGGEPPYIEIGATRQGDQAMYYWVKDNGSGLTPEQQQKVFLPFSRLQERRVKGHGLGLAIVRLIARRLGGEATVTSQLGAGSSFGFTLMSVME